jgi:hypothetical protein
MNSRNEEIRKNAYEKVAQVKVYNLQLILEIIDLASSRGAFKGQELSHVGTVYDILASGVNKAIEISEKEIKQKETIIEKVEKVEERIPETVIESVETQEVVG